MTRTLACRGLALAAVLLAGIAPAQSPSYRTARQPQADPALSAQAAGVLFHIPGIGTDFVLSGGGQFVELPNGSARLTGRILSASVIYDAFLVDLVFGGRVDPGNAGHPPAGAPVLGLLPGAYAPSGPVDPATFRYYTTASGTLTGVRNLEGARVALQLQNGAVQVGAGASNRNGLLGASATFTVQVLQQPAFPFGAVSTAAFHCDLLADRALDLTHVQVDPSHSALPSDRGLVLPGVGDYVFVPAGRMTEHTDGHAEIHGTVASLQALDDAWQLDLVLQGRVDAGQAGHPPAGAPSLGLLATAYVAQGGPIDPTHWHYYQTVTGTLTGTRANAGGVIALLQNGPLQVGAGANQANTYFGIFGALVATVQSQPTGRTVNVTGTAQLHGLTGTFPVLPFPQLNAPGAHPTLPTVTDAGIVLTGNNLAWIEQVQFGPDLIASTDPANWANGYFRVLDNQRIEVHPRQGRAPGTYSVGVINPAVLIGWVPVDLVTPASAVLRSERLIPVGRDQHLLIHRGGGSGPVLTALAYSTDLLPSVVPGVVSLGIGNQLQSLGVLPGTFPHDPTTGVARVTLGPIPPALLGLRLHFQAALAELVALTTPLPVSDVWTVDYVQ